MHSSSAHPLVSLNYLCCQHSFLYKSVIHLLLVQYAHTLLNGAAEDDKTFFVAKPETHSYQFSQGLHISFTVLSKNMQVLLLNTVQSDDRLS